MSEILNTAGRLPRALLDDRNNFDLEVLNEAVATIKAPRKQIRELIQSISGLRISPTANALDHLGKMLFDADFRQRWALAHDQNNKIIPPISQLLLTWCASKLPSEAPHPRDIPDLFKKSFRTINHKVKIFLYPHEKAVSVFLRQVQTARDVDERIAAIYYWALIEEISANAKILPHERSLSVFVNEISKQIAFPPFAWLQEALELFEPPGHRDQKNVPLESPPILRSAKNLEEKLDASRNGSPINADKFSSITTWVQRWRDSYRDLKSQISSARSQINSLEVGSESSAYEQVSEIIQQLPRRRNNYTEAHSELSIKISRLVEEKAVLLGARVASELIQSSVMNWDPAAASIPELEAFRDAVEKISEEEEKEKDLTTFEICQKYYNLEISSFHEFLTAATVFKNNIRLIECSSKSISVLRSRLVENALNLDWAFQSSDISQEIDWSSIASLKLRDGQFTALTWISARCLNDLAVEGIAKYLSVISANLNVTASLVSFLSHLKFDQIERIGKTSERCRELSQIALFSIFLDSCVKGVENDYTAWSYYPLNDISSSSNSSGSDRFFHLAYLLFSSISGFDLNRLRKLIVLGLLKDVASSTSGMNNISQEIKKLNYNISVNVKIIDSAISDYLHEREKQIDVLTYDDVIELQCSNGAQAWTRLWISQHEELHPKNESQKQRLEDGILERVEAARFLLLQHAAYEIRKTIGDVKNEELAFLLFLEKSTESSKNELVTACSWVIQQSSESPRRYLLSTSNRQAGAESELLVSLLVPNPMWPRTTRSVSESSSSCVSLAELATDLMCEELNIYSPSEIALIYSDQHLLEGYQSLLAEYREKIPPDLERDIEQKFEKLGRDNEEILSELRYGIDSLPEAKGITVLEEVILGAEKHLAACRFRAFSEEIKAAKAMLSAAIADSKMRGALLQWTDLLNDLGGEACENDSLNALKDKCAKLEEETKAQRRHLHSLEKLNQLSLNPATSRALFKAQSTLRKWNELPSVDNSDFVSYLFSEIFDPLAEQLRRSQNFLPAYRRELDELTENILISLSAEGSVSDAGSIQLKALERFSSKIFTIADLDIQGVAALRETIAADIAHLLPKIQSATEDADSEESTGIEIVENPVVETIGLEQIVSYLGSDLALIRSQSDEESLLRKWTEKARFTEETSCEQLAAVVALASRLSDGSTMATRLSSKNVKGTAWEIPARFIIRLAAAEQPNQQQRTVGESLEYLASKVGFSGQSQELGQIAFGVSTTANPSAVRWLWEHFSGDNKQAEYRAALLVYLAQCGLTECVAYCLSIAPIEFNHKKAKAIAFAASQAYKFRDKNIIETFNSLRRTGSRPFQLFSEAVSTLLPAQSQTTVLISIMGDLQSISSRKDVYETVLKILPNTNDWVQSIKINIPTLVPLRASDGTCVISCDGPFVEEQMLPIHLRVTDAQASNFIARVTCTAVSISGALSNFVVDLNISISGAPPFERAKTAEIERAFSSFPAQHMRGDEYIPRAEDERRIERALVLSNTVRSLWISSPRRSGKTTMLYRILDEYSHKVGRDNAVIYLTIDRTFSRSEEFNDWVWKRIVTSTANSELRTSFPNIVAAGSHLPYDADAGTFFEHIAEIFLNNQDPVKCGRVIFLIDEVDRFAAMHFDGGVKRDTAWNIIWQIREVIGQRRNIGFVFAGSSAAKRIFVTSPDSPLFNYITLLELAPFSCKDKTAEQYSRMVIEPTSLRNKFHYPKESLEHLIWICAGIPYYMKLLSGATLASARQRHILKSTVNDALSALLLKRTGIVDLDEIGGDPGADELRTMALESDKDKLLARAVLYTMAEMLSPVSGLRLRRGRIAAEDSPLISRYKLSRSDIDRGLEVALELGIIALTSDKYPEVYFPIPILGESLRNSRGRNWATIDHQLSEIGGANG